MQSLEQFWYLYKSAMNGKHGQRLGQMFCNLYLVHSEGAVPGLYNERNEEKAREMIRAWLLDNQYTDTLPPIRNNALATMIGIPTWART